MTVIERNYTAFPAKSEAADADTEIVWSAADAAMRKMTCAEKKQSAAQYRTFDTSPAGVPTTEGTLSWDSDDHTLAVSTQFSNVTLQVGQEIHMRVTNKSSVDIKNGEVVYIDGAQGNRPTIALADASDADKYKMIGMCTHDIDDNANGIVTVRGIVRELDTNAFTEGDLVYLSATTPGGLQNTMPSSPNFVMQLGVVTIKSPAPASLTGQIQIIPSDTVAAYTLERLQNNEIISKEPTGFTAPEDVIITGDSATRTVTVTGTVNAYYRGTLNTTLITGYTSPAHDNTTTKTFFLVYDGTVNWVDTTTIDPDSFYDKLLIAIAFYNATDANWVYQRECHGLMGWQTHRELHDVIGTYRESGGTAADYVLSSTTAADRRPSISAAEIMDEDLPNEITALPVNTYTQFYIDGAAGDTNFITAGTDIVPLSGAQPYWNEFTGGVWQQTLISNNYYMNIYVAAIPTAADANSQKLRYVFLQGQGQYASAAGAADESVNDLTFGSLSGLTPEIVFILKFTIRYQAANWTITTVTDLTGTKISQSQSASGLYLSSVNSDATLTGTGTSTDALGIDLTNANSWTGQQIFGTTIPQTPLVPTADDDLVNKKYNDHHSATTGNGFVDSSVTALTYNPLVSPCTIELAPTGASFQYYINRQIHTVLAASPLTDTQTATTGVYHWYIDSTNTLQMSASKPDLKTEMYIAQTVFDLTPGDITPTGAVIDKRYLSSDDIEFPDIAYAYSGFAASSYTVQPAVPADADNQLGIAQGVIQDNDIFTTITALTAGVGPYFAFYRTGSEWTFGPSSLFPFLSGTYPQYNEDTGGGSYTMTDIGDAEFVNYWIVSIPIASGTSQDKRILFVPSQAKHTSLANAQAEEFTSLAIDGGFLPTFAPLYKVTFGAASGYVTTGKCRIDALADLRSLTQKDFEDPNYFDTKPIYTLPEATVMQGQTVSFSGNLTVESDSVINQDLSTDSATAQLAKLTISGEQLDVNSTQAILYHGSNNRFFGGAGNATNTGNNCTAVGSVALDSLTSGYSNVAMGSGALTAVLGGYSNVGIGVNAGNSITSGDSNICIGDGSDAGTTGSDNICIGFNAGSGISSATNENTLLGHRAASGIAIGDGNVIIGNLSAANGAFASITNKLIVANTNTTSPLIYGDFSAATLTFNGALDTTGDTTIGSNLILSASASPSTPAAGKVSLYVNGSGQLVALNASGDDVILL